MRDPYELLRVPYDVDEPALKKRFRELAKRHHPDAGGDAEKFKLIAQAYDRIALDLSTGVAFAPAPEESTEPEPPKGDVRGDADPRWEAGETLWNIRGAYATPPDVSRPNRFPYLKLLFGAAAALVFAAAITVNMSRFQTASRTAPIDPPSPPDRSPPKFADTPPADPSDPNARVTYLARVSTQLRTAKYFPAGTPSGFLILRFVISSSGAVTSRAVLRSSGSQMLDDAIVGMVDRASPFPPFPPEIEAKQMSITLPINVRNGSAPPAEPGFLKDPRLSRPILSPSVPASPGP